MGAGTQNLDRIATRQRFYTDAAERAIDRGTEQAERQQARRGARRQQARNRAAERSAWAGPKGEDD